MRRTFLAAAAFALITIAVPARADDYAVDDVHSSVGFKIQHLGISWIQGRFDEVSGTFTLDKDPAKSSFELTLKTESIDTNNKNRDTHLKSPDFFNAKQYPTISFKSKSVKAVDGGYEVKGDLTMHGETKPISFTLKGGKEVDFMGKKRTGFSTELTLKRFDFGMDKFKEALSDDVQVAVSFEGAKK
ncbi:MAG TPA: YceI family protein [Gemmataceae bacterium]|jgi:polyisoprenoid-binding protein YceI